MTAAESFSRSVSEMSVPRQRPGEATLCVQRPSPGTAVVVVRGEVDQLTAPRLTEMFASRLRGTLRTLVVDLSKVDFLGAAGLSALIYADLFARQSGVAFRIVTGDNRWAIRPLTAAGLTQHLTITRTLG
jgi:anti-anti-sigma factor